MMLCCLWILVMIRIGFRNPMEIDPHGGDENGSDSYEAGRRFGDG